MNIKTLKKRITLLLALLVSISCEFKEENRNLISSDGSQITTRGSGTCFPEVVDKYVYPVVPGMEEWNQAIYPDSPIKFCQLPAGVLKSISTPGLIDALIHAPLFESFYMLSSNTSALKWHQQYELFNSAGELFKRQDAGNALVAYYKLVCLDSECIRLSFTKSETSKPFDLFELEIHHRMLGLECLFTKQEVLERMDHGKKKEAIAALLANYNDYSENVNSIFPMAFIMYADKYAPMLEYARNHTEWFQAILNGYLYSVDDQVNLIISFAKDFTK